MSERIGPTHRRRSFSMQNKLETGIVLSLCMFLTAFSTRQRTQLLSGWKRLLARSTVIEVFKRPNPRNRIVTADSHFPHLGQKLRRMTVRLLPESTASSGSSRGPSYRKLGPGVRLFKQIGGHLNFRWKSSPEFPAARDESSGAGPQP